MIGDPIELAALKGVEWKYDANKQARAANSPPPKKKDTPQYAFTGVLCVR